MGASASEVCYASAMKRVDPRLTQNARHLRNSSTRAERLLWLRLRQYRPRFTRQLVIGPYIVDLACREAKLAIELDGGQHATAVTYDDRRTAFLEEQGWAVVRLWNNEVVENPEGAAELVLIRCTERLDGATHPQPLPCREGRVRRHRYD
ncbi:MAG: DUF559 domain-containing protein [Sphingomicrobium sp.]